MPRAARRPPPSPAPPPPLSIAPRVTDAGEEALAQIYGGDSNFGFGYDGEGEDAADEAGGTDHFGVLPLDWLSSPARSLERASFTAASKLSF